MLDLTQTTVVSGFASALLVLAIILIRQRRLDTADLGSIGVAFFAGSNIPVAIFLCLYALDPDPPTIPTKLHGYEKHVAFAGLAFLFITLITIWSLCNKAFKATAKPKEKIATQQSTQLKQDSSTSIKENK
jgi:hypothetical protein